VRSDYHHGYCYDDVVKPCIMCYGPHIMHKLKDAFHVSRDRQGSKSWQHSKLGAAFFPYDLVDLLKQYEYMSVTPGIKNFVSLR